MFNVWQEKHQLQYEFYKFLKLGKDTFSKLYCMHSVFLMIQQFAIHKTWQICFTKLVLQIF